MRADQLALDQGDAGSREASEAPVPLRLWARTAAVRRLASGVAESL